jgi:TolB-like protein/class 3 adenylate cyclase
LESVDLLARERRLAAIFVADAVGYSTLMGLDEDGTHEKYKSDIKNVIEPLLARFHGRAIKKTGDGLLALFPSVVQAVECASRMQGCLPTEPKDVERRPELVYRIGINIGDVIVEDDDIYGNDVNVAVRLESLSAPGTFTLSGPAYWNVKGKTPLKFEELGFLRLKNIVEPIQVYQAVSLLPRQEAGKQDDISDKPSTSLPMASAQAGTKKIRQRTWSEGRYYQPEIAVLPFNNLSDSAEQDYFCAGLTSDLTTDLARFSNLFIIAATTAAIYKGQRPSPERIRRELAVDYMVQGDVQRLDRQLRINVQLIETTTGQHLWGDRFRGSTDELFNVQDDVTSKILMAVVKKLDDAELMKVRRKETDDVNAYDAFLKGLHFLQNFLGSDERRVTLDSARYWLERAIELDPVYARPHGWLAYLWVLSRKHGWGNESVLATAEDLARKAVALDPNDHDTHWALASVYSNCGKFDQALAEYERAVEINRNDANLHAEMADLLSYAGKHSEAIGQLRFAMRINPNFPEWYRWTLGSCYYFIEQYEEAIAELGKLVNFSQDALLILAASHARLADGGGSAAEHSRLAHHYMKRFRECRPGWTFADQETITYYRNSRDAVHWLDGLRLAGLV